MWIINIYALVVSGLLLGMGTLGDRLGHKRLLMVGLTVFGAASLMAAFAATTGLLIVARALLGVGAAMMMPATLSLIRLSFRDDQERALAIGIWASVASGSAAFGPVVGGLLLEYFWWGSVFLINVPMVLIALPLAWRCIPARVGNRRRPWDMTGSIQVMLGLMASTYALKELGKHTPNWAVAALTLAVGMAFLWIFVQRQRSSANPLLDLALFKKTGFSLAAMSAVVAAAALMGMELVFSQRMQLVLDRTPLQAGMAVLPLPVAAFIAGPVAGRGSARLLTRSLLIAGLGMGAYLLLYQAPALWPSMSLVVLGLGTGAAITAASSTMLTSAPADRAGMLASVEEVSYELGGALGVTVMGSLLSAVHAHSLDITQALSIELPVHVFDSLDEALLAADKLPAQAALELIAAARAAFDQGFSAVLLLATSLLLIMASWARWHVR